MKIKADLIKRVSLKITGKPAEKKLAFAAVVTDSRKEMDQSLFIPIIGERFDGHQFIEQAVENGAAGSLWQKDKPIPASVKYKIPFFLVEDTTEALQDLSVEYLKEVSPKVIGVTGSNGKTTVKDMLEAVLSNTFETFKTQGNFNNHWGMPLTILSMPKTTEVLILEMGMSGLGEISFLSKLATPDLAIITNIGESHLEQLKTRENIAKAKMEIIDGLKENGTVIVDGDEPLLMPLLESGALGCGYSNTCDYRITDVKSGNEGSSFVIEPANEEYALPLLGKHNVKNSVYSIVAAKRLGVTNANIKQGLSSLKLTNMRLERFEGINGSLLINDAYNASPTSMKAALETLSSLEGYSKKIAVLGDMYELGENEVILHRNIADAVSPSITKVITVGEKGKWIADGLNEKSKQDVPVLSFIDKNKAAEALKSELGNDTAVLFKASRGLELETIIKQVTN
ncbi:UDP-N-acetylmuramoyl-tripeptide--D-alanyl-D-alanine ligase [Pseudalkalibacillus caeni]|uniref:UDP-N-acetylmuramoyl-tripeptide--D-alanyl-D-alanine ligase n=1 Tax=Exobacillus caeni TaxID=2574798 RepID=A0A5R9EYT8_9BACL|nr:UDP-N-acetylmuramoyl-tripeptide--D-alanyl-D-alanine ligase [Pseudalkalibacillus caeni]TLS35240.1 UDP-N-acetylmuramoyl-tripeptide--D-alanyl-D-alanine ligase [Pseudalkalibacillus caeni]